MSSPPYSAATPAASNISSPSSSWASSGASSSFATLPFGRAFGIFGGAGFEEIGVFYAV